jgi:hypothetical protein
VTFDIVAFDPAATSDRRFATWYAKQVQLIDDATVTTPALRAFFADLALIYPPANGPEAPTIAEIAADRDLETRLTEYSIGPQHIRAAFHRARAESATTTFEGLAARHRVAIARVSRDPMTISRPRLARRRLRRIRPAKLDPPDIL